MVDAWKRRRSAQNNVTRTQVIVLPIHIFSGLSALAQILQIASHIPTLKIQRQLTAFTRGLGVEITDRYPQKPQSLFARVAFE
jgi:hypothetical protein